MEMSQASLIFGTTSKVFPGLTTEAEEQLGAPLEVPEAPGQTRFHRLLEAVEKEKALLSDSGLKLEKGTQMMEISQGADSAEKNEETDHIPLITHRDQTFDLSEIREVKISFSAVKMVLMRPPSEENASIKEDMDQDEVALPAGEKSLSASIPTAQVTERHAGLIGDTNQFLGKPADTEESGVASSPDSTEAGFFPAVENRLKSLNRSKNPEGVKALSEAYHRSRPMNSSSRQEGVEWETRHQMSLSDPVFSGLTGVEPEVKPGIPAQTFSEEGGLGELKDKPGFLKTSNIFFQEKPSEAIGSDSSAKEGLGIKMDHNDVQIQSEPGKTLSSNEILSRVEGNRKGNFQQANEGAMAGASSSLSGFSKPLLKEAERDFTRSKQASPETGLEKISDITSEGLPLKGEDKIDRLMIRRETSSFSGRFPLTSPAESVSPESFESKNTEGKQAEIALQKASLNGMEDFSAQRAVLPQLAPLSGRYSPSVSDEYLSPDPFGLEEIDGTQTKSAAAKSSLEGTESPFDQRATLSQLAHFSGRFSLTPPAEARSTNSFGLEEIVGPEEIEGKQTEIALTKTSLDGADSLSDQRAILRQLAQRLRSWRPEDGTPIRLQLNPKRLGSLEIEMSIHEKGVSAHILTGDLFVKELLEGNQTFLREALAGQGLKMDQFSVALGGRGAQAFDQRGGGSFFQKSFSQPSQQGSEPLAGLSGLNGRFHTEKAGVGRVNVYI